MAPFRRSAFGRGGDWVCPWSLRFVLRFRSVCGRIHYRRCGYFARCAEVIYVDEWANSPVAFFTFRTEAFRACHIKDFSVSLS
jgi:hypothetical protein